VDESVPSTPSNFGIDEAISITLRSSTLKLIDLEAQRQDRSRSNLIDHILREYLRERLLSSP